jgi:hypothetical protein
MGAAIRRVCSGPDSRYTPTLPTCIVKRRTLDLNGCSHVGGRIRAPRGQSSRYNTPDPHNQRNRLESRGVATMPVAIQNGPQMTQTSTLMKSR